MKQFYKTFFSFLCGENVDNRWSLLMQWKLEQHTYTIRDQLLQLGIKDTTYQLLVKSLHFSHISIIFVMHLGKRYALKKNLPSDQNYDFKRNWDCFKMVVRLDLFVELFVFPFEKNAFFVNYK